MSDFDYIQQDAALSMAEARSLIPPDEIEHEDGCRAWKHRGQCDCPTHEDYKIMDADERRKSELEG